MPGKKNRAEKPQKWWKYPDSNYTLDDLAKHTNTEYIPATNNIKAMAKQLLPDTFYPMFPTDRIDTSLSHKCYIKGKYLVTQHRDGVHLDLSTMETLENIPVLDKRPSARYILPACTKEDKDKHFIYFKGLTGKLRSKQQLKILHESERWLLVRDCEYRDDDDGVPPVPVRFVDKKTAVDGIIDYDEKNTITFPAGYKDTNTFHFLENSSAILQIVYDFQSSSNDIFVMFFNEQGSFTKPVHLATFKDAVLEKLKKTGKRDTHMDTIGHRDRHDRAESFVYAGMLYLSNYNRELIPLWVDFDAETPFVGSKFAWHTLRLKPYGSTERDPSPFTRNGRWISLRQSTGRSVCDLLTFKTYIVRDSGWREELYDRRNQKYGTAGACWSGVDSDNKPIFYIIPKHVLWFMWWDINRDKEYDTYWDELEGEYLTKLSDKPVRPHNPEQFLADCQGILFTDSFFQLDMSGDYDEPVRPVIDQEERDWKLPGEVR